MGSLQGQSCVRVRIITGNYRNGPDDVEKDDWLTHKKEKERKRAAFQEGKEGN